MKGQISFIMKPMMLIAVIVLLVFLLQSLYSARGRERLAEKNLDIVGTATNILLILSNSKDCLAYDYPETVEKANVLDVDKLDSFDLDYDEIEPECARNYEFGWRVDVEQFGKDGVEREWDFGAKDFSTGKSLNNEVKFWIPVAIRHDENDIRLGKMSVRLVNGELEKLAGFFDWSCRMGELNRMTSLSTDVMISQPVTYNSVDGLCMGGSCRELLCKLEYFDGFESEGTYSLTVNYQNGKLLVSK